MAQQRARTYRHGHEIREVFLPRPVRVRRDPSRSARHFLRHVSHRLVRVITHICSRKLSFLAIFAAMAAPSGAWDLPSSAERSCRDSSRLGRRGSSSTSRVAVVSSRQNATRRAMASSRGPVCFEGGRKNAYWGRFDRENVPYGLFLLERKRSRLSERKRDVGRTGRGEGRLIPSRRLGPSLHEGEEVSDAPRGPSMAGSSK
eukprot:scaffold718_cov342-Pavlova_lutheri.AAC.44